MNTGDKKQVDKGKIILSTCHLVTLKTYKLINSKTYKLKNMTLYPQLILDALKNVRYPGTGKNLIEMDMVEDNIRIDGMNVTFSLIFLTIRLSVRW